MHITLKEHDMKIVQKEEANARLHEIDDANSFLELHGENNFNAELEDVPQLLKEADYEWLE